MQKPRYLYIVTLLCKGGSSLLAMSAPIILIKNKKQQPRSANENILERARGLRHTTREPLLINRPQ